MCGIAGFWQRDGKEASEVVLERMIEKIRTRGPDDAGTWSRGGIGLGHCRLSILDLSEKGHQPFFTSDLQGVISYNGEVYNYAELRRDLEKEGIRFLSHTDTEVVLYALHHWGPEKAASLFNGMFAFAYLDRRSQTLWLGRDRAAIKPLYYARAGDVFVFASEMKALFEHPAVPCAPDMHALTTQVIWRRLVGEWTPFQNVKALKPGSLMKITRESEEVITYFDILRDLDVHRIMEGESISFESYLSLFESLFPESVKAHLVSDAPLATMCSGGLDSSLMTAYARKFKPDLVAYVAEVKGIDVSEAEKAERVCRHLGVPIRRVPVDREDYIRMWPQAVYQNDQPNFFTQNVIVSYIAQAAHRDGFKVLLAGEGSDELFGGYDWQVDVYRMWRLRRLHARWLPNTSWFRFLGRFTTKLAPFDLEELAKRPFKHLTEKTREGLDTSTRHVALDGAQRFLREEALFGKLRPLKRHEDRAFLARSFEDFYSHLSTALTSNDKMGMLHSVEMRFPFLSSELIDFGIHLPRFAKYSKKMTKRLVKTTAEKYLPRDIVHARKIGFGVSDYSWKHTEKFLQGGMVQEMFKWSESDFEPVSKIVESDPALTFHLLSMELWARMYLLGQEPDSLGEKLLEISQGNGKSRVSVPREVEIFHAGV